MKALKALLVAALLACTSCATLWQSESERDIRTQLQSFIVPECCFRSADIYCVVAFLNNTMEAELKDGYPHIVLLLPHGKTTDLIDLDMRDASVLDVVNVVAKLTESKFYIRGNHPYLEPRAPHAVELFDMEQDPFE
jgi:hypothetical protein